MHTVNAFAFLFVVAALGGFAATPDSLTRSDSATAAAVTVAVFGDSWGYGAHCGGCTPWPKLPEAGYERQFGASVDVIDFVENGGNTDSLLAEFRTDPQYREAIAAADVVVVSQGVNDFDSFGDVFLSCADGTCGGPGGLDCLSVFADHWRQNLEGFATEVATLRDGKPTALRLAGVSIEYLSDPGLSFMSPELGAATFGGFNDVWCEVATAHGGACVDLRPVLNGPMEQRPWFVSVLDETDPRRLIAVVVENGTDILQRLAPLAETMSVAAIGEPAAAEAIATINSRRHAAFERIVARVAEAAPLRVPADRAVDVVDVVQSAPTFNALMVRRWAVVEFKAWSFRLLTNQLLPSLAAQKLAEANAAAVDGLTFQDLIERDGRPVAT